MEIQHIALQNYKSIEDAEFSMSGSTILIGKNNSGKSSVLDALYDVREYFADFERVHNRPTDDWITERCSGKKPNSGFSIEIIVKLNDGLWSGLLRELEDEYMSTHRRQINPDKIRENEWLSEYKIKIDFRHSEKDNIEWHVNMHGDFKEFENINKNHEISGLDIGDIKNKIKESIKTWRKVEPFRVPENNLQTRYTTDLMPDGENLIQVLDSLQRNKGDKYKRISDSYISIMEGVSNINVEYIPSEGDDRLTLAVYEDSYETKFVSEDISSGSKEILVLLTQLYLAAESADLLLLEEPELHLHPGAEREIFSVISDVVASGTQVVISTHSDVFVNKESPSSIVKVERDGQTSLRTVDENEISEELIDLGYSKSGLLQSDAVVFVEGLSDKLILSEWASTAGIDLDERGISIIELEGEGNIETHGRSLVKLLYSFSIPYLFLIDSDGVDPHDAITNVTQEINREEFEWHTTPGEFFAWDDSDIEYFFVNCPSSVASVLNEDVEEVSDKIGESRKIKDKNADVLDYVWKEFNSGQRDGYLKDIHGKMIAKHMEELPDEVEDLIEEIENLA